MNDHGWSVDRCVTFIHITRSHTNNNQDIYFKIVFYVLFELLNYQNMYF